MEEAKLIYGTTINEEEAFESHAAHAGLITRWQVVRDFRDFVTKFLLNTEEQEAVYLRQLRKLWEQQEAICMSVNGRCP